MTKNLEVPDRFELSHDGFADLIRCTRAQGIEYDSATLTPVSARVEYQSQARMERKWSAQLPTPSSSWTIHPGGIVTRLGRRPTPTRGPHRKDGIICRACGVEFAGTSNRVACSDRCRVALRQVRGPRRAKTSAELKAYNKAKQAERYKRLREAGLCVRCGGAPAVGWACVDCAAAHAKNAVAARKTAKSVAGLP